MILVVGSTSTGSIVTKSNSFLCVVIPWKKLHIWTWSSRQLRLPDRDSTSIPSSALATCSLDGHSPAALYAFSTPALYDSTVK